MWDYTDDVMDHFLNPRNVGKVENPDGEALVGSLSCGDALELSFKLDDNRRIKDVKFRTFGCASAIASSSILTEMIKGMTLEEAEKITNDDIVKRLGGLPNKKIHCSVMGVDALKAAIANYRGEDPKGSDYTEYEGTEICHCFHVTDKKIRALAKEYNLKRVEEITDYCKAGGACGLCKDKIEEILNKLWEEEDEEKRAGKNNKKGEMSFAQKVIKINEIIDNEIKPMLEKDGGSIEFVDLEGSNVIVKLVGHCASCPASKVTIKEFVEKKLKELVSDDIVVIQQ